MTQPEFRRRITARMRRLPQPIPTVWTLVDRLHYAIDAAITSTERVHLRLHERMTRSRLRRANTVPEGSSMEPGRHARIAHRVYDTARAAHWYV
ncbi:hypothetical protein [Nocardia sp. NBC_01388]|uniref:hypothetical protein n=1 Tax=Nocardia sp. NBC_01388 TaxID=2903596 RepID=UPI003244AD2A